MIEECVTILQGAFGEMRSHCEKVVVKRCQQAGVEMCAIAEAGLTCPAGQTDCGTHCCPADRPSCADNTKACCPAGYHIACGGGVCCPRSHPRCVDGNCFSLE